MSASFDRMAKIAGSALAATSLVFIIALFWRERGVLSTLRLGIAEATILCLCALAYGCLGWVLAEAWRRLLVWTGEEHVQAVTTRRIYARTQIAKYIPGNVAQFAGRQLIGREAGWSHVGLLLSTIFELISLVFVAAAIAVVAITSGAQGIVEPWLLAVATVLILAGLVILPRLGPPMLARRWPEAAQRVARLRVRDLWSVSACHAFFFIVCGLILVFVTQAVTGEAVPHQHWPALIGLFAITWIVSTLTPGAPSGIGVREAVLVAGLAFMMTAGSAILVATLLRLITVSGDMLFFLFAGLGTGR